MEAESDSFAGWLLRDAKCTVINVTVQYLHVYVGRHGQKCGECQRGSAGSYKFSGPMACG